MHENLPFDGLRSWYCVIGGLVCVITLQTYSNKCMYRSSYICIKCKPMHNWTSDTWLIFDMKSDSNQWIRKLINFVNFFFIGFVFRALKAHRKSCTTSKNVSKYLVFPTFSVFDNQVGHFWGTVMKLFCC